MHQVPTLPGSSRDFKQAVSRNGPQFLLSSKNDSLLSEGALFIITGGGRGIGRALACALAAREQRVCIIGRNERDLIETTLQSPNIQYVCSDVSSPEGRERIQAHLSSVSDIRGLIHNAGIIEPMALLGEVSESSWERCMATNVAAPVFLTQVFLKQLRSGRVLNISSGAAHFPVVSWGGYCVSKAALSMLTRCWQLDYPNMAFASVMPGIIDTQMQAFIRASNAMHPDKRAFFERLKNEGRLLSVDTVALFLCWLLLDVDVNEYRLKEWDIYDTTHHAAWLVSPHKVPVFCD